MRQELGCAFTRGVFPTDLYHRLPLNARDDLLRLGDRLTSWAKAAREKRDRGRRNRAIKSHVRAALETARAGGGA